MVENIDKRYSLRFYNKRRLTSKEMEIIHPIKNTYLYAMILILILKNKFLIQENHQSD